MVASSSRASLVIDRPAQFRALHLAQSELDAQFMTKPDIVSVTGDGHSITVQWTGVDGANDVQVDSATLQIGPYVDVPAQAAEWHVTAVVDNQVYDVTVVNATRVRSLVLDGVTLGSGQHLAIAVDAGKGLGPPLYTAPEINAPNSVMPASFTGATFDNGTHTLTLPDVAANKLRLSLVTDDFPTKVVPQPLTLGATVRGIAATLPSNLQLVDDDGATVWAFPGEMPPQTAMLTVDLRHAIEKILKPKAKTQKSGQSLTATFKLRGVTGKAAVLFSGASGAIVRNVPGVITTELAGEPVVLAVPQPALAAELPSRATADVVVKYHGIRLHETLMDPVPPKAGDVGGIIVTGAPVARKLPPAALNDMQVAKIGIIGRAPVDCELVVQLFDFSSGGAGAAVTQPATVTLHPSDEIRAIWLDIPHHDAISVPIGISARTNHGRFLWAANHDPLLRLAIFDADPGGRLVSIGGSDAVRVDAAVVHKPMGIDSPAFASAPPLIDSDLFATVDLSDLTLEYDR